MADLTNKELLIPLGTFSDMQKRVKAYQNKERKNPTIVYINGVNKKDYIAYGRYWDMEQRVQQFRKNNPNEPLKNVWIKKPVASSNVLKAPVTSNNVVPTVKIKGKQYQPHNFTEFYNLMGGFGYSYYYNDVYSLSQEISNLSNGKAMNCTDLAQLGVYIASQFKKDGKQVYSTRYAHINCRNGGGHTTFQIKGGEFKDKWTMIDLAAKADKNGRVYHIGDYWCRDGVIRGYNELWVLKDDGKT